MTPSPNAALAAEPSAERGRLPAVLARGPWGAVRRVLRLLDPVWPEPAPRPGAPPAMQGPGAAARRDELDDRLLDHLAG